MTIKMVPLKGKCVVCGKNSVERWVYAKEKTLVALRVVHRRCQSAADDALILDAWGNPAKSFKRQ